MITLAPDLAARASASHACLHGFEASPCVGHWNVEGHRAVAELLARPLCELMAAR